jgi:hypothetical protein
MLTVTLSYAQFRAARHYGTARHADYFDLAQLDGKRRRVTMPVAGWKKLLDLLAEACFTKWGKVARKQLADADGVAAPEALAKISKAVAKIEAHPALRGEMVIGFSQERFIVWPTVAPSGALWSLTPVGNNDASILLPRFEPRPVVTVGSAGFRFREGITWWRGEPYGPASESRGW